MYHLPQVIQIDKIKPWKSYTILLLSEYLEGISDSRGCSLFYLIHNTTLLLLLQQMQNSFDTANKSAQVKQKEFRLTAIKP